MAQAQVVPATTHVSVIVPVFNRSSELRRVLESLCCQQGLPGDCEILICDDGSTEDIEIVVAEYREHCLFPIHYLRQENQGPGAARNLGLRHAQYGIVAFTDSDCLPAPDWLATLIEPIRHNQTGMTGGLYDFRTADHRSGRYINFLMSSMLGAGGARDPRSAVHMKYYPRTGNAAVLREVALAAGGFPTHNHGEDVEFSDRVMAQNVQIQFVPAAIVVHNEKRTMKQVWCEAYRKGTARVRLAQERGVHEWIHALPALLVAGLLLSICVALLFPQVAVLAITPFIAYALILMLIGLQGGLVLRDLFAVVAVPVYATLMHTGYGIGYLVHRCTRNASYRPPAPSPSRMTGVAVGEENALPEN